MTAAHPCPCSARLAVAPSGALVTRGGRAVVRPVLVGHFVYACSRGPSSFEAPERTVEWLVTRDPVQA